MARPQKIGLDYFSFDVDFFEDEKIEAISGEFGIKGEITAIKLLATIYRNGYFLEWSELVKMKLLKRLPTVSLDLMEQIVKRLVRWGFFDETLFNSANILSSKGIQKRYAQSVYERKLVELDARYWLIALPKNGLLVDEKKQSLTTNEVSRTINDINRAKSTQSKVKEIKVKESKKKGGGRLPEAVFFQEKKEHGENQNVRLLEKEYATLLEKLGEEKTKKCIEKLSFFKLSNGTEYKSDYGAINNWVIRAVEEDALKMQKNKAFFNKKERPGQILRDSLTTDEW